MVHRARGPQPAPVTGTGIRVDAVERPSGIPATLRVAGAATALEGLAGVVAGAYILLRAVGGGHHEDYISGYGTAMWFLAIGGAVLAAGIGLLGGRGWGRGFSAVVQVLLLPVAYSLLTGSHLPVLGMIVAVLALGILVALFAPASTAYLTAGDRTPGDRTGDDLPEDGRAGR